MSHYSHHRGRTIGRILHFLHAYLPYHIASNATIGGGYIKYARGTLAAYTWETLFGLGDVPVFTFLDDPGGAFANIQRSRRAEAIAEGCVWCAPPDDERKPVDAAVLEILMPKGYRSVRLYSQGVRRTEPTFFMCGGELFADMAGQLHSWNQEMGDWLLRFDGEPVVYVRMDADEAAPA